jgi:molybdopterin converting factor small subunit
MVTIRLFAAAREAAGTSSENAEPGTVAQLCAGLVERHGPAFARVLGVSTVLVAGDRERPDSQRELPDGAVVDILPPFAGG